MADNINESLVTDEQDILLTNTPSENKERLKEMLRRVPRHSRTRILTVLLAMGIVALVLVYYFKHV